MNSAAFYTLGCKVNQAETRRLASALCERGWQVFDCKDTVDVYIINSCAVTAESARKTRQAVRRFKKNNPKSKVALIGCMPSVADNLDELLPEADLVLRQDEKNSLPDALEKWRTESADQKMSSSFGAVRAAVKIQDGCDNFCSYCVIPLARGAARSVPAEKILDECHFVLSGGVREIILTGINLCRWGKGLCGLVRTVSTMQGLLRLRLGSLEPDLLSLEMLKELSQIQKLCPHFHISLQSGSDSILKRMNRNYSASEFEELCGSLRRLIPNCTITTDIIVGFPGETDKEFNDTLSFVRKIAFEKVHVFPYSSRPGTRAADMPLQIPKAVKEERTRILIAETSIYRQSFLVSQLGKRVEILPEEIDEEGFTRGYTANYVPVRVHGSFLSKALLEVEINRVKNDYCEGFSISP